MLRANEKGFTLIEVVVVAILVAVLTGAGYAFFFALTKEKTETAAYLKAQMQSEALFDVLAKHTRNADFILEARNAPNNLDPTLADIYTDSVFFFTSNPTNNSRTLVAALGVRRSGAYNTANITAYLVEWNNSNNRWDTVKVAGSPVSLVGDSLGGYWDLDTAGWNAAATNYASNKTAATNGKTNKKAFAIRRQGGYPTRVEADFVVKTKYNNNKDSLTIKPERGVFECLLMN